MGGDKLVYGKEGGGDMKLKYTFECEARPTGSASSAIRSVQIDLSKIGHFAPKSLNIRNLYGKIATG